MTHPVIHSMFTIEHTYSATAARVFHAFSDPKKKRRWFAEGKGFVIDSYTLDFQVGGFERCRFRFGEGPLMTLDSVCLDIIPEQRIMFAYAMTLGGVPMSSSLGTMEFLPDAAGTRLRFTEQCAFVDGNDGSAGRREGSIGMLEGLAQELHAYA